MHVSRSLRRRLRSDRYTVSVDLAFDEVIERCAGVRATTGTWITPAMRSAYVRLHEMGYAHAVETWHGNELVGGLYGIALGGVFFGESMFSRESDASKAALARLVERGLVAGLTLIDCQLPTPHLRSLGSQPMSRGEFSARIREGTGVADVPLFSDTGN
jgi:leucyl/phenylalanyl-tRNA--protein transferase